MTDKKMETYRFKVLVKIGTEQRVVEVYITSTYRDTAAMYVPGAVCDKLGFDVSSRDMRIVEG